MNVEYEAEMMKALSHLDIQTISIDDLNSKIVDTITTYLQTECRSTPEKQSKFSDKTIDLIAKRREMLNDGKRDTDEYRQINKTINKEMKADLRRFNVLLATNTIETNKNMKVLRKKMRDSKTQIFKLKDKDGVMQTDRQKILNVVKEFYEQLYKSVKQKPSGNSNCHGPVIMNVGSEDIPEITVEEARAALIEMKNNKAPGEDELPIEAVKEGGDILFRASRHQILPVRNRLNTMDSFHSLLHTRLLLCNDNRNNQRIIKSSNDDDDDGYDDGSSDYGIGRSIDGIVNDNGCGSCSGNSRCHKFAAFVTPSKTIRTKRSKTIFWQFLVTVIYTLLYFSTSTCLAARQEDINSIHLSEFMFVVP
ncbi:hypothetical protein Bhyg_10150 [Pseudolycoriella hygida]|uniref:Uncharacterized protein n=1 Tax=Pseudolycoriella hygida TaxID=35572 RepID=A0A9Q0MSZ3_9DIPT|nr:hypothetical protein Bhyg_10150 [Pseudolycoriella hygida]